MQTNVWKIEKLTEGLLTKLHVHPSNLVNNIAIHKLCKIQFWKKLFAIGFPYRHCNFRLLCLPVKMALKTVIRPVVEVLDSTSLS